MRALSDKWNPRLWLREWINGPSQHELAARAEGERASRAFFEELSKHSREPQSLSPALAPAERTPATLPPADSASRPRALQSGPPLPE